MTELSTCGCCRGLEALTPAEISNPPALRAIAYRTGTWATFRETMLAALATRAPALEALDPYAADDFAPALIDAWAVACDVLSFYEERVANESYLRTAVERRSLLELARAIGYELGPGVAASAWLAFAIEEPPPLAVMPPPGSSIGAPQRIARIPMRTKVQSVPGPDEKAQMFETVEAIEGWPEWNTIRPLLVHAAARANRIVIAGRTDVKAGDRLVRPTRQVVIATNVEYRADLDLTIVLHTGAGGAVTVTDALTEAPQLFASSGLATSTTLTAAEAATLIVGRVWRVADLATLATLRNWDLDQLIQQIREKATPAAPEDAWSFRQRAAPFGHNAPAWSALPASIRTPPTPPPAAASVIDPPYTQWDDSTTLPAENFLDLDARYPTIAKGGFIAVEDGETRVAYTVEKTEERTRSAYTLVAKVTRVGLVAAETMAAPLSQFHMRLATVYAESIRLPVALEPLETPVGGLELKLDGVFLRLEKGQHLVVSGTRNDARTLTASEVVELDEVNLDHGLTYVKFKTALQHTYVRRTVTINANVAAATHGETTSEILGSGDAGQPYQVFALRQKPLTHVRAETARGVTSTLEVFVNDVRWTEVPSLHGHGPNERIYTSRIGDDGTAVIRFGDGLTGARLPTGEQNVRAVYRRGIGIEGLVRAEQLSLLMDRPYGVKGVTNPVPSRDADAPESRDEARANAPLTVLTLDRIVSIRDFEDFARAFAGVAKAMATSVEGDDRRTVVVTVAGPNGLPVDPVPLTKSMRALGDPFVSFVVRTYRRVFFRVTANIVVDADRVPEIVFAAIENAMRERFSFDARSFGQSVTRGEIVAAIQSVAGVTSVTVTLTNAAGAAVDRINAAIPSRASADGADLLLLDTAPLDLRRSTA